MNNTPTTNRHLPDFLDYMDEAKDRVREITRAIGDHLGLTPETINGLSVGDAERARRLVAQAARMTES